MRRISIRIFTCGKFPLHESHWKLVPVHQQGDKNSCIFFFWPGCQGLVEDFFPLGLTLSLICQTTEQGTKITFFPMNNLASR